MNTKIILLTGKAQSGKDSAAQFILSKLLEKNQTAKCYSFASNLKDICHNILGLSYDQCWGSNLHKDTKTKFKWSDLPVSSEKLSTLMIKDQNYKKIDDFMTAREVMQVWGTDIFRSFDENCWVRSTVNMIESENLNFAIITDARFENEVDYIKKFEPIIIRLTRNILNQNHESELALDNYDFFGPNVYVINNENLNIEDKNLEIELILNKYL